MTSYLIESKCLREGKTPSCFEGSPDHCATSGGRGTRETKWVGKLQATYLYADVNIIYGREELWKTWFLRDIYVVQGLKNKTYNLQKVLAEYTCFVFFPFVQYAVITVFGLHRFTFNINAQQPLYNTIVGVHSIDRVS